MNGAHLHLLLNHIPVLGFVGGLTLLAYAVVSRRSEATQIALALFVLSGLATIAAYLSGEPAEEVVEGLSNVSEVFLERHEEAGLYAMISAVVLAVISGVELFSFRQGLPKWTSRITLLLALVVSIVFIWTANLGGKISHPEIRGGANAQDGVEAAEREPSESYEGEARENE